jgi:hypothetical protein
LDVPLVFSGTGKSFYSSFCYLLLCADAFYRTSVAPLVHRVSGAVFKMYHSQTEAQEAFDRASDIGAILVV